VVALSAPPRREGMSLPTPYYDHGLHKDIMVQLRHEYLPVWLRKAIKRWKDNPQCCSKLHIWTQPSKYGKDEIALSAYFRRTNYGMANQTETVADRLNTSAYRRIHKSKNAFRFWKVETPASSCDGAKTWATRSQGRNCPSPELSAQ